MDISNKINTNIGGGDTLNEACFYKCKYDFVYGGIGSCNAINQGNMIQLDYPENKDDSIVYNNLKYTPRQIFIYYPSYFNYYDKNNSEGKKADAEISIYHTNATSTPLIVNIPIYINTSSATTSSTLITEIITNVSKNAPNKNEKTTIIFSSNFSLKKIIPVKPFYNFYDNIKSANYVIFGNENSISISTVTYNNMLVKILNTYDSSAKQDIDEGPFIYYNANGPNSNPVNNDIYISCKPTGSSEDTTDIIVDKKDDGSGGDTFNQKSQSQMSAVEFFQSIYGIITILFIIIIIIVLIYLGFLTFVKRKDPNRNLTLNELFRGDIRTNQSTPMRGLDP